MGIKNYYKAITILGSSGGVAKAILSILNKSVQDKYDPINAVIENSLIHLVDIKEVDREIFVEQCPNLKNQLVIHHYKVMNEEIFMDHLKRTNTSVVIDVSWADTVEMMKSCEKLGIDYINTALENPYIDEHEEIFAGFGLIERMKHLEKYKDSITNSRAILCSGMNPGVVQWMAIELWKNNSSNKSLLACYIVEHDNSFFKDKTLAKKDVIYTTWSPECFLDEAILSYPMFMKQKTPLLIYQNVYDIEFKVTLGDKLFYGCLMPHEEVYSLGKLFNIETGFLYKVNDHTTNIIRSNIDNLDPLWEFEMKVLDPLEAEIEGVDLCGVLLVYEDKEIYMYNVMDNKEIALKFKVNATYFQVACGIYAALSSLLLDEIPSKAYFVEELLLNTRSHYGEYLTYYMKEFVIGENQRTDGLLLDRMRKFES